MSLSGASGVDAHQPKIGGAALFAGRRLGCVQNPFLSGIVDAGVTVALAWGLLALLFGLRAAATDPGR